MVYARKTRCLLITCIFISSIFRQAFGAGLQIDRNLHLGSWSPFASYWEGRSAVCAWTESDDVAFQIIAFNQNNSNDFQLTNGSGDGVSISLFWEYIDSPGTGEKLKAGRPSSQTYYYDSGYGCGVSPNYSMLFKVNKADLDNAMPGTYRGALMLILSPI